MDPYGTAEVRYGVEAEQLEAQEHLAEIGRPLVGAGTGEHLHRDGLGDRRGCCVSVREESTNQQHPLRGGRPIGLTAQAAPRLTYAAARPPVPATRRTLGAGAGPTNSGGAMSR